MSQTTLGRLLKIAGLVLIFIWVISQMLSFRSRQPLFYLIVWIGILAAGFIVERKGRTEVRPAKAKPNLPPDFVIAYEHDNIALDTQHGRLWLRDGQRVRVFSKDQILSWQLLTSEMQAPTMVSGGVVMPGKRVQHNARLAIQTKDLDHPLYTILFRGHSEFLSTDKNVAEAQVWANRFTAFMNS